MATTFLGLEGANIHVYTVANGYIITDRYVHKYIAKTEKEVIKIVLELLKQQRS